MQTATHHNAQTAQLSTAPFAVQFPPLALVNKPNLTTAEAAFYLNRAPQTLRAWACLENFPAGLRCRRIGGLLAWPTVEVKALAGVPA